MYSIDFDKKEVLKHIENLQQELMTVKRLISSHEIQKNNKKTQIQKIRKQLIDEESLMFLWMFGKLGKA